MSWGGRQGLPDRMQYFNTECKALRSKLSCPICICPRGASAMASDVVGPWEMPFTGLPRRMAPSDLCRSTRSKSLPELDRTLGIRAFENSWHQAGCVQCETQREVRNSAHPQSLPWGRVRLPASVDEQHEGFQGLSRVTHQAIDLAGARKQVSSLPISLPRCVLD